VRRPELTDVLHLILGAGVSGPAVWRPGALGRAGVAPFCHEGGGALGGAKLWVLAMLAARWGAAARGFGPAAKGAPNVTPPALGARRMAGRGGGTGAFRSSKGLWWRMVPRVKGDLTCVRYA
jgi:hypothetical protein